jgi:carboxymethylenebutenolidase
MLSSERQIGTVSGYLQTPEEEGPWPAVIVVPEWWGLNPQIESVARRIAILGYLTFAPDLFHGEYADLGDHEKAAALTQKYGPAGPVELEKVFDALRADSSCTGSIGIVGFCFGGRMSLALGLRRPVHAICTFYGGGMDQLFGQLKDLKAPVLGLYGDQDRSIPVGTVEEFDRLLDAVGVEHEIVTYPDSGHAFFRDTDPASYRPKAAADAWDRLVKFFDRYLL